MFTRSAVSASVIEACYEAKGIFADCNRGYDSEAVQGEDSVKIPLLSEIEAMEKDELTEVGGAAKSGTDVKGDTSMVEVPLTPTFIRLKSTVEARIMKSPQLLDNYVKESKRKLIRTYNSQVLEEVNGTTNKLALNGAELQISDFVGLRKHFDDNEIPEEGRVCVVASAYQEQLWNIDFVQRAASFNQEMLKTGVFVEFLGFKFYVSALNPLYTGKPTIQAFYGPAVAMIIPSFTEEKSNYDLTTGTEYTDMISWKGVKLALAKYAAVKY